MITYYPMIYNNPAHDSYQRYWGPSMPSGDYGDKVLPLMDLDTLEAWLAERGYSADMLADWELMTHTDLEYTNDGGFEFTPGRVTTDSVTYESYRSELMPDEVPDWLADVPPNPHLDPDSDIWREWANSVDIESILGPQAAGGKLGPGPGEYWYQWHPEGFDVSSLANNQDFFDIFSIMPDWWPERLEVPVHDPALFSLGGTISPISPDTGLYYFEACLWASGGLFGPWSLPHPDLPWRRLTPPGGYRAGSTPRGSSSRSANPPTVPAPPASPAPISTSTGCGAGNGPPASSTNGSSSRTGRRCAVERRCAKPV